MTYDMLRQLVAFLAGFSTTIDSSLLLNPHRIGEF